MKILIAEDNKDIALQISEFLTEQHYICRIESDGESVCFEGEEGGFDLILLDIGLPMMDGFSILEKWRSLGIDTPVICLTARDSKMDVVRGLEAGADDYLAKPFDMNELLARIKALLKRSKGVSKSSFLSYKDITLDTKHNKVLRVGTVIKLTRTEYRMVHYLFMHQGKTVNSSELAEHVYEDFDSDLTLITKHVANIRKKIGHNIIHTDANRGYTIPCE